MAAQEYARSCLQRCGLATVEQLADRVRTPDRKAEYFLYEAACALKYDLVPWADLPPQVLETRNLMRCTGVTRRREGLLIEDIGADCASLDLSTTLQAKWYGDKSRISYTHLSTFLMTSTFAEATTRLLVRPSGVGYSKSQCKNRSKFFTECTLDAEEMIELLSPYLAAEQQQQQQIVTDSVAADKAHTVNKAPAAEKAPIAKEAASADEAAAADLVLATDDEEKELSPAPVDLVHSAVVVVTSTSAAGGGLPTVVRTLEELLGDVLHRMHGYQQYSFSKLWKGIGDGNAKQICEIGCGGGKSWIMLALAVCWSLKKDTPVVIIVPSLVLVGQHIVTAKKLFGLTLGYVVGGHKNVTNITIVVANSIQTYLDEKTPELILGDEAHHILRHVKCRSEGGDESDDEDSDDSGFLRTCSEIPGQHVYFTATPPDGVVPNICIPFGDLIENNHLVDYCVWVPYFGDETWHTSASSQSYFQSVAQLAAEMPTWKRILAFCNRVENCIILSQEMDKSGIPSAWMSGATKVAQRLELFKKLESGEIRCIVSVETISEGLDIPAADTCIFAEPRTSHSRIIQCVGRVLRKSSGKTVAHVVVPAMHSHALRIVLNRLVISTPRLREAFKNQTEGRISFIASSTCDEDTKKQCELQQLNLYTSLGQVLGGDSQWLAKLQLLNEYVGEFQALPAQRTTYQDVKLGIWCDKQRQAFKGKGNSRPLTAEQVTALTAVPGWWWEQDLDAQWLAKLQLLNEYVGEFQTLPARNITYQDVKLGSWCNTQRTAFKGKGNRRPLTAEQVTALNAVPGWWWEQDLDAQWLAKLQLLNEYVGEFQTLPTKNITYKDVKLGIWCDTQRQAFKGKGTWRHLTAEQVTSLTAVPGWWWEQDMDAQWLAKLQLLNEYVGEFQTLPTQNITYQDVKLGKWCNNQRTAFKGKGNFRPLTAEQVTALTAVPGWWWTKR